jgi:hypothetical protein
MLQLLCELRWFVAAAAVAVCIMVLMLVRLLCMIVCAWKLHGCACCACMVVFVL